MKTAVITLFIFGVAAVLWASFKSGHFFKNLFTAAFQGIVSLFAVNVLGLLTGVTIAINWYTLTCVSFFGMPSVIGCVLLNSFLK